MKKILFILLLTSSLFAFTWNLFTGTLSPTTRVFAGSETVTSLSATISTATFETIVNAGDNDSELVLTLAKPGKDGVLKLITVKNVSENIAIEVTGLLDSKVTINMNAINDTLYLRYSTPNYYIIGGNSYAIE